MQLDNVAFNGLRCLMIVQLADDDWYHVDFPEFRFDFL